MQAAEAADARARVRKGETMMSACIEGLEEILLPT